MAKLSTRGRTVIYSLSRNLPVDTPAIVSERKSHIKIMSDRSVMHKMQVRFTPDPYYPKGRLHDWGWHCKGKVKAEATLKQCCDRYLECGYHLG